MASSKSFPVENGNGIAQLLAPLLPHPELRGGGSYPSAHKFSHGQLLALRSICDTILPSVTDGDEQDENEVDDQGKLQAKARLMRSSASDAGIVLEIAWMICSWLTSFQFLLTHLALLLLSSRLGTLLLAGLLSMTWEFPFLHTFAQLPLSRREAILRAWSRSPFKYLQMFFKVVKCYTLYKFYSRADENGKNLAWDAIGYSVPVDLHCQKQQQQPEELKQQQEQSVLSARIVNAKGACGRDLSARLASLGCSMLDDVDKLSRLDKDKLKSEGLKNTAEDDIGIECDVVVVGSGSGGGVVAARLASMGHSVVVLEKGAYYPPHGLSLLEGPSMLAMYEQSGALTTVDGQFILLTGSTFGGGSAVNWAAAFQTPDEVVRHWASLGLPRFHNEYEQAMEAVCHRLGVQDKCSEESFQNAALRKGCAALGYPIDRIPRNAGENHHCGFCSFGCPNPPDSRKQSTADTWLSDAAAAGAVMITNCAAQAILSDVPHKAHSRNELPRWLHSQKQQPRRRRAAAGVVCRLDSGGSLYIASRACVAACGSLWTPPLLRRSGLRNWHIGRHLSLHPVVAVWGFFPPGEAPPGSIFEGGIMTSFATVAGGSCLLQTPCLHPGAFAVLAPWRSGLDSKRRMLDYARTANVIVLNRDKGRGTVEQDSRGKLLVDYRLGEMDKAKLVEGVQAALRAMHAAGAQSLGTHCFHGETFDRSSPACSFQEFLERAASRMFKGISTPLMSAHQMGTCRMGASAPTSAVDANCQSWEVDGLFVADASVFPTSSGVNPMLSVQANSYCTATAIANYLDTTSL